MLGDIMKKIALIIFCIAIVCSGRLSAQNAFVVQQNRTYNVMAVDNDGTARPKVLVSSVPEIFNFSQKEQPGISDSEKPLSYSRYIYHRLDGSVYESTNLKVWNKTSKVADNDDLNDHSGNKTAAIVTNSVANLKVEAGSNYEVFSIIGCKLEKGSFNGIAIDFSNYQNGLYIVLINNKVYKILKIN
jgi:hypothetical protein